MWIRNSTSRVVAPSRNQGPDWAKRIVQDSKVKVLLSLSKSTFGRRLTMRQPQSTFYT